MDCTRLDWLALMGANPCSRPEPTKHHGMKAFINMSQMTVSEMSVTETTRARNRSCSGFQSRRLNWSGLPVVHLRPTVCSPEMSRWQ
jgi:hypothetical protein